jgi:phosphate:Na+ symporter
MAPSLNLWTLVTNLAGGVGLFLLGMTMMTDGLKLAAGPALERILASATRTRWQALGSGMLVTALVQSSSAITVATIGFVNAGLLSLGSALWVLFGANVGTTMTGWIVALVGLKFKIEALALPLIGVGVLLRLTGAGQRRGAMGTTLAGFGLLFFGIAMLQTSFSGLATQVSLPQGTGPLAVLAQVGIGALMTVLMQSSSASMTIALTAAQGGLLTPQGAAAVVIGANIGTTVTAMLAAMGATPNARRAASAHVAFNLITGVVALALLPWLINALGLAREAMGLPADPAAKLALFHTIFNLLGVLLMWPLAAPLTRWLQARFRAREEDEAQTRYLDDNVLQVPLLAVDALKREVSRVGHVAVRLARAAGAGAEAPALARDQAVFTQLITAIEGFVERLSRRPLSQKTSEQLTQVLRVLRYHESITEQVHACAPLRVPGVDGPALAELHQQFVNRCDALLAACDPQAPDPGPGHLEERSQHMEAAYEALKTGLLAVGATGGVRLASMEETLRRYSALRRAAQQAAKARRRWPNDEPDQQS